MLLREKNNILSHVIAGFPRSGTTLTNEIFRNHPEIDSGFEVGVLLCESPRIFRYFRPYSHMLTKSWQLDSDEFDYICHTDSYYEFYRRLRKKSKWIVNKNTKIFDKTPAYMKCLDKILKRVDCNIIVTYKDAPAVFMSWTMSGNEAEDIINKLYDKYLQAYRDNCNSFLRHANNSRIKLFKYENFVINPVTNFSKMFNHVGLEFKEEYLKYDSRYFNAGTCITNDHLDKYKYYLSKKLIDKINRDTEDLAEEMIKHKQ